MKKRYFLILTALFVVACLMLAGCDEASFEDELESLVSTDATTTAPETVETEPETEEETTDEITSEGESTTDDSNVPAGPAENQQETLNGKTPFELYQEITARLNAELTNFTQINETYQEMTFQGQTIPQTVTMISMMDDNMNTYSYTSTTLMGETTESTTYYVDGWLYCTDPTVGNFKLQMTWEEMYEMVYGEGVDSQERVYEFTEDYFEGIYFTKEEDGSYNITLELRGEMAFDMLENMGTDTTGMEISLVTYVMNFDENGQFVNLEYSFDMVISGVTATSVSTVTIKDIGTTAPITAPEDADSYEDYTNMIG